MKKFIFGILFTILIGSISSYTWENTEKEKSPILYSISSFITYDILQGYYILNILEHKCEDRQGQNGFGWKFNIADYNQCDRLQRLLNGNYKPYNPNSNSEH